MGRKTKKKRKKKQRQQREMAQIAWMNTEFRKAKRALEYGDEEHIDKWTRAITGGLVIMFFRYLESYGIDYYVIEPDEGEDAIYIQINYSNMAHYIELGKFIESIMYTIDENGCESMDYEFLTNAQYNYKKVYNAMNNKMEEILDMIDEIDEQPNKKGA